MAFITIGNHTINLDKVCNFQVYGPKENDDFAVIEVEYEHRSCEIPCAGGYSRVINDLRNALGKYDVVLRGPEIYIGE